MSELVTKSVAQEQQEQKIETRTVVDVPDAFTQAFVIEKDSKRFLKSGG